jgi:4-amino-4-deoxy-L-arabinose transferase-like glycosyltransferase
MIAVWVLWAAFFNTAQFGDNIEQFNWAQHLSWGYHKHPPLPTWLLGGVIHTFGPSIYWAYLLAGLCLAGTAILTWLMAHELVGPRAAAVTVVLWGLNLTFSQRAQLYNHNTVLVLCMVATVWSALCATRPDPLLARRWLWWLATGAAAGAAMLSKYQALVPLAGVCVALIWSGRLQRVSHRLGLLLAVTVALAVVAPHAVWVAQHHYSTLRYAATAVEPSGLGQRLGFVASFVANQVRLWFPALVVMGWCWWRTPKIMPSLPARPVTTELPLSKVWIWGLFGVGLVALLLMALLAGVSLRNHWGVQTLQFLSIAVAAAWQQHRAISMRQLISAALMVHATSGAIYAVQHQKSNRFSDNRREDTHYPAALLADTAVAHWEAHTKCPLKYVTGSAFEGGLVSLYSSGQPRVFENEQATPWLSIVDIKNNGALYVFNTNMEPEKGIQHIIDFELNSKRDKKIIKIGLRPPEKACTSNQKTKMP